MAQGSQTGRGPRMDLLLQNASDRKVQLVKGGLADMAANLPGCRNPQCLLLTTPGWSWQCIEVTERVQIPIKTNVGRQGSPDQFLEDGHGSYSPQSRFLGCHSLTTTCRFSR